MLMSLPSTTSWSIVAGRWAEPMGSPPPVGSFMIKPAVFERLVEDRAGLADFTING
jgi:hypothetical protein